LVGIDSFNVDLSAQLCELAARIPVVTLSTSAAASPTAIKTARWLKRTAGLGAPYAATKIAPEVLIRAVAAESHVPLTIVRPFSYSGTGDKGSRCFLHCFAQR